MQEIIKIAVGVLVLALGIPIGDLLAKQTKEELKSGQFWFKTLITFSLVGAVLSLIYGSDALLFGMLFIAVVTSRSLKTRKKR